MKLSELIAHIGDENVKMQPLSTSMLRAKVKKAVAEITFATEVTLAQQAMNALVGISKPDHVGLIVWIPREKIPEVLQGRL